MSSATPPIDDFDIEKAKQTLPQLDCTLDDKYTDIVKMAREKVGPKGHFVMHSTIKMSPDVQVEALAPACEDSWSMLKHPIYEIYGFYAVTEEQYNEFEKKSKERFAKIVTPHIDRKFGHK